MARMAPANHTRGDLLRIAENVTMAPLRHHSVFYFGKGNEAACALVKRSRKYTRIGDVLKQTGLGAILHRELNREHGDRRVHDWSAVGRVWWHLSERFAEATSGVVHCFGEERDLLPSGSAELFRSKHIGNKSHFVDELFWKVEYPILENSSRVDRVLLNGVEI